MENASSKFCPLSLTDSGPPQNEVSQYTGAVKSETVWRINNVIDHDKHPLHSVAITKLNICNILY